MTDASNDIWGAPRKPIIDPMPKPDVKSAPTSREAELLAKIKALVEALKPFADYMHTDEGRMDLDGAGSPLSDDLAVGWIYLTHGDFRSARTALAAAKETT